MNTNNNNNNNKMAGEKDPAALLPGSAPPPPPGVGQSVPPPPYSQAQYALAGMPPGQFAYYPSTGQVQMLPPGTAMYQQHPGMPGPPPPYDAATSSQQASPPPQQQQQQQQQQIPAGYAYNPYYLQQLQQQQYAYAQYAPALYAAGYPYGMAPPPPNMAVIMPDGFDSMARFDGIARPSIPPPPPGVAPNMAQLAMMYNQGNQVVVGQKKSNFF